MKISEVKKEVKKRLLYIILQQKHGVKSFNDNFHIFKLSDNTGKYYLNDDSNDYYNKYLLMFNLLIFYLNIKLNYFFEN